MSEMRRDSIMINVTIQLYYHNSRKNDKGGKLWFIAQSVARKLRMIALFVTVASVENRLATSADFLVAATGKLDEKKAMDIAICVTAGTDDVRLYGLRVSEVAAACMIQMGYYK